MVKITRHNSLWSKVAVLLFAIHPIQDRPAQTKIEHLGESERDRNISCEAAILGKHVISDSFVSAKQLAVSCPASKSDLVESLVSNGVTVTETGDWAYLVPTRLLPPWKSDVPVYMRLSWKALIVDWQVTNFPNPGIPGSRPLSLAELREVESQILSHGRMIPIADPASETDPAIIPLRLVVDCHRLSAKGPESVIAVLHQDPTTNPGRLFYGEIREGKFVLLWDSPVIHARLLSVGYEDIDGDGVSEILISTFLPGNVAYPAVTFFNAAGSEITRQNDPVACNDLLQVNGDDPNTSIACPIFGDSEALVSLADGVKALVVKGWAFSGSRKQVFRLKDGHYVPRPTVPVIPLSQSLSAAQLNDQGMEFMTQEKYFMAAAKFFEAADLSPHEALFQNNAGFAWFQTGDFEEAVKCYLKAIEIDPSRAIAYLNLGDAYAKLNRTAEARQAYTKYLELAPNSKSAPDVKKKLAVLPPDP